MKRLPMVEKAKKKLKQNPKISIIDLDIKLTNQQPTPVLKDILEDNVDEKYYLKDEQVKKILSLSSLDHITRKQVVKKKLPIPEVENTVKDGSYININHLGQNGSLTCDVSRTITCVDTPHVTEKVIGRDVSFCIDANYIKGANNNITKSRRQLIFEE